ncbi:MAG: protein-disulfide reductase DsbD family protein [Flavobacteriaceae bacterium]|nr:protein-disulfide reductase DsbD family protein [Flavobacteriaceae bacterium]
MKKLAMLCLLVMTTNLTLGQIHDPVQWETATKKISDTEYELITTAIIDGEWHLYSQSVPEDGPIPTTFTYESNSNYLKKGNTKEEKGKTVEDSIFGMRIKYFGKKAKFTQRIKLKTKEAFKLKAVVEFMVCNDSQCLPPKEVDLEFTIN